MDLVSEKITFSLFIFATFSFSFVYGVSCTLWCILGSNYFISFSIPTCRKYNCRCWTVDGVLQTGGARSSRTTDQLQQERAAGPLPGIQKRQSVIDLCSICFTLCLYTIWILKLFICRESLSIFPQHNFVFHSFPQECPSGVVNEETFKHIYSQFFPHGGQSHPHSTHIFISSCQNFTSIFLVSK